MIDLRCGRWQEALADVGEVDAVILDAPYSAKTHKGHFAGSVDTDQDGAEYLKRKGYDDKRTRRASIDYGSFSEGDVQELVASWAPRCRGWFVSITDHILGPVWQDAFDKAGLYSFAPLPFVEIGKQPRLTGDGPASWTCWIMVARPKSRRFASWGSLPGAYCTSNKDQNRIPGGKTPWLMQQLVNDYTRPGDLVADPVAGGATTLIAAHTLGRRAIGAEMDPATHAKAQARIDRHLRQGTLFEPAVLCSQPRLEV